MSDEIKVGASFETQLGLSDEIKVGASFVKELDKEELEALSGCGGRGMPEDSANIKPESVIAAAQKIGQETKEKFLAWINDGERPK